MSKRNVDDKVVAGFGDEWKRFSNTELSQAELEEMFESYVRCFPWTSLPHDATGFDAGCGSGRWAEFFAQRVGHLHCVDASEEALDVAREKLRRFSNVTFHQCDLDSMDLEPNSMDFGYSLGVLHHIPDTASATKSCVDKLKPGAPFLVYLYYSVDDASLPKRAIFRCVSAIRWVVSRLPHWLRVPIADIFAVLVYWPLAQAARGLEQLGRDSSRLPLFQYRHRSFYVMRNDALDRFGTRLEKRYTKAQVEALMADAGLVGISFSAEPPWWVAVGNKAQTDPTSSDSVAKSNGPGGRD